MIKSHRQQDVRSKQESQPKCAISEATGGHNSFAGQDANFGVPISDLHPVPFLHTYLVVRPVSRIRARVFQTRTLHSDTVPFAVRLHASAGRCWFLLGASAT